MVGIDHPQIVSLSRCVDSAACILYHFNYSEHLLHSWFLSNFPPMVFADDFLQRGETRGRRLGAPILGIVFLPAHFDFGNDFANDSHSGLQDGVGFALGFPSTNILRDSNVKHTFRERCAALCLLQCGCSWLYSRMILWLFYHARPPVKVFNEPVSVDENLHL